MTMQSHPWGASATPLDELGGETAVRQIVDSFYDLIDSNAPTIRAMLPADDAVSRRKLGDYLVEWTGGPDLYTSERGHPMMRARHLPFPIGLEEVEQWLACMATALDEHKVEGEVRIFLDAKITALAHHMRNK